MPPWQKGQSGNPSGRKPKNRALTDILEKAGAATLTADGKKISGKRLMAQLLWEAVTTGKAHFPDGRTLEIAPQDWLAIVKFLYQHIDGPAKSEIELSGAGGGPIEHKVDHGIDGDTATSIFDILAAAGVFQPGADDAANDGVHPPQADA